MFKRRKGYLLLTMLVLTGLAGRIHSDTLSGKERRHLITELKTSRAKFLETIQGLSKKQLQYRSNKHQLSIEECVRRAAIFENALWSASVIALQQSPHRAHETEDSLLQARFYQYMNDCSPYLHPASNKNFQEAVTLYNDERNEALRYARTTTENVHSHFIQTAWGKPDIYQVILMMSYSSSYYTRQIESIKSSASFPH
ncbi:MAG: hypothetical protein ACJ75B_14955 [Flavisolibacter sp.]